jgi:hypothetical protein
MHPDQAAQLRRQVQNDRQEENRRKRAFDTGLTGSGSQGNAQASGSVSAATPRQNGQGALASGANTPREEVDDIVAA